MNNSGLKQQACAKLTDALDRSGKLSKNDHPRMLSLSTLGWGLRDGPASALRSVSSA
jgi:hypothetical protein